MLIDPATISPVLVLLGFIMAIGSGLLWVKNSYTLAKIFDKPKPLVIQSILKVVTCVLSFAFVYLACTYQWL